MKHVRIATYEIKRGLLPGARRRRTGRDAARVPEPARVHPVRSGRLRRQDVCLAQPVGDAQGADAASRISETWDREHIADRVELRTNQVGDLAFYEGVPAKV